jgi:DNA mismatch repair protein MutS2
MQPSVLRALEFDRIREALAREALTPLGRAYAWSLVPAVEPDDVRERLALASETFAFTRSGSLSLDAPEDLKEILGALDVQDQALGPLALLGLARFVDSVRDAAARIRAARSDAAGGSYDGLRAIAARAATFDDETAAIRRGIEPSGDVADRASPALAEIRDALRRHRAKLRSTLDGLARGRETSKYLQDQIVTDRNGRYVLVVRAEHRDAIPGIVHGSSASGASLYLEPLSTVPVNNDIVALAEREKAEVHRILLSLTNAFRLRADDLEATIDVAADLDALQAGARLARRMDGVAPELAGDGRIELRGARHPLLIPAVRDLLVGGAGDADPGDEDGRPERAAGPATVVPSDLLVVPPARALVISGPNTGGKTVALKAIGLLALMAQSGLLIPVEPGSRITPFRSVFADIGDEQSIAASLSTFSARIANLVAMNNALDPPALVLMDEVGSGTDPMEGGALGAAVIDHFRARGATIVATTHDDALKSYAATTDGVTTGAFGFTPDTYAPTYRLIYGAPGRSLALEIAERLGMPASVIADARARRSGRETLLAAHLGRVDAELAGLERARLVVERDGAAMTRERDRLLAQEARIAEREAILKKRSGERLNEKLREARAEVDRIVSQLKEKADALAARAGRRTAAGAAALSTGEIGQLRASALSAIGGLETAAGIGGASGDAAAAAGAERLTRAPAVGQAVYLPAFATDATVVSVSGQRVDVDVRGKRMRVTLDDLRRSERSGTRETPRTSPTQPVGRPDTRQTLAAPAREIVVVGATVDDAVGRVEKFIDDALLADEKRLRVVHGRGTGRLREGLRDFLREHPVVASVAAADDDQGGDAVTIVELRD